MKQEVFNIQGETTGRSVELADDIFGIEPNEHVVYLAVKHYLANQRQGTHKAKERGEVAGSTRKIKRQKGTGTARAGDIKNPLFRGGGRVFGPRPRTYSSRINKKVKQLARKSALSGKIADDALAIVEDFSFESPATSSFVNILSAFEVAGKKSLLITADYEREVYLSARNLQKAQVLNANEVSTYDILNADKVLISEGAVDKLSTQLS
ncbi:MAG TPA: 50S ribosomal protein L4 [Saprospiraceae bacterium]|nr:50S ribosomal protein L4 [Saprospiraceae bacterium]